MVGQCTIHGDVEYGKQEISEDSGKALCPECKKVLHPAFELVLGKKYRIWRCPVKEIDADSVYLVKLVNWSEECGITPNGGGLLNETNFYYEVRTAVVTERDQAIREFDEKRSQNQPPNSAGKSRPHLSKHR